MMPRTLAIVVLATLAASCAVGPRYTPPAPPMPADWREAPPAQGAFDRSSLERWWMTFRDPMLDDLIARAIEGNLDLKIAAARIRESRAARGIAASATLPQVGVYGQATRSGRSEAVPPFNAPNGANALFGSRTQNTFEVGFDAGWELDVFGGARSDVEAATAQVQAVEEGRRDVLVTLLADVARNYSEIRGIQHQIEILDDTVRSQQDTLDIARARFDAGLGTALDVDRAEGLLEATRSRRPVLEREVKRAMYRIDVLVGRQPGTGAATRDAAQPLPAQPPTLPETLPSELLSRRPDLRRAERDVAASTARLRVARADLFPRFAIGGNFGRRSDDVSDLGSTGSQFWFLVGGVRLPILSGGRIRANIRVQDARQEQALRQYEKAVLTAVEEVENALLAHSHELRRLATLRATVAANRRALDLATERYTGGLENFLSVLDAQRAVYAAEDSVAQSETNVMVALIAVYKSLGGGWTMDANAGAGVPK
jgi:multidrug efflux system outer membrane protein